MTQGKSWRDGQDTVKKHNLKKMKEQRYPIKRFKQKRIKIIEDDLDQELESFMGMRGFRQS